MKGSSKTTYPTCFPPLYYDHYAICIEYYNLIKDYISTVVRETSWDMIKSKKNIKTTIYNRFLGYDFLLFFEERIPIPFLLTIIL